MCNVCEAGTTLERTKEDPEIGYKLYWKENPNAVACIRAYGKPEGKARYQIKWKESDKWPDQWESTNDLAGSLGHLGFDVIWSMVPQSTKELMGV